MLCCLTFTNRYLQMSAHIISSETDSVTIEVTIEFTNSMLKSEEAILEAVNEVGNLASQGALKSFDTDGSPIMIGPDKWTSKGQELKTYQTPYGGVEIARHVYQSSKGGETYCPLERDARIVVTSTPRLAKIVSNKYANLASTQVQRDLADNHGRNVARSYLQNLSEAVGSFAAAKEEDWHYTTPKLDEPVKSVSIGVDGTCMLLCKEGYREAMVGTISLYDDDGERQHTIQIGATPEYGKATFWRRMEREIAQVKKIYPQATYVGIADGSPDNWSFLEQHTDKQTLDFYHATGYLKGAASAAFPRSQTKRKNWLDEKCHELKNVTGAALLILDELKTFEQKKLSRIIKDNLESAITYFENHHPEMNYAESLEENLPIGSGVTEAACKTLVKQRLCQSGMKWVEKGAGIVLSLRSLVLSPGRWKQFWDKINQYGLPLAA